MWLKPTYKMALFRWLKPNGNQNTSLAIALTLIICRRFTKIKCIFAKKNAMKYLLLIGLIYMIYKYNELKAQIGLGNGQDASKINQNDNDGEYVDYEEVD